MNRIVFMRLIFFDQLGLRQLKGEIDGNNEMDRKNEN
jgi:hypothetical protein